MLAAVWTTLSSTQSAPAAVMPISDVSQRGSLVTFSLESNDEPHRFELRMLGPGRGELTMLLSDDDRAELDADGRPAPKPIPVTRR